MFDIAFVENRPCVFSLRRVAFCFAWLFGLLSGCFTGLLSVPYAFSLMRSAVLQPVSIVGLLFALFFPLLISYFAFLCEKPIVTWIVSFLKMFAFGYCGILIGQYYDSAAWMLRLLLLFSDGIYLLVLFLLWFRHSDGCLRSLSRDFFITAVAGAVIVIVDISVVSPFLVELF